MKQNREYKDRLFKFIFGRDCEESKRWLLSLYNALNGSNYTDTSELTLTTIENIIYITMKNDVSFLIDNQMTLYEQQSSFNPNMPLRGLMYFAELYQIYLSRKHKALFSSKLVKIPSPRFIVLYNGGINKDDVIKLKLSDSFEVPDTSGEFEWTATMININRGHNETLQKNCKPLYDYCRYVSRVKENLKSFSLSETVNEAVDFAIRENLLDGFFKKQKMEILNMSLTEFDQEEYDYIRRQEGYEDGSHDAKLETARTALGMNLSLEQIIQLTGLSEEEINQLK